MEEVALNNHVKPILVSLTAVLVIVAGTVVGTNLVTAEPASSPAPVTVTFNYSGATGGNTLPSDTVTSGTQADAELPHPTKPGESFTGWFSTQSLLNGQRITTIEESDAGTLIAGFIPPELGQTLNLVLPTASCAQGGACIVGDTGPGGGLVFYDAGSVQPWGRYLEMAPNTWSGSSNDDTPALLWCDVDTFIAGAVGTDIGTGAANTTAMNSACNSADAAAKVLAYAPSGSTAGQWFLPSKNELNAMYGYYRGPMVDKVKFGFAIANYWSSSQDATANASAWYQAFSLTSSGSSQFSGYKSNDPKRVRPIRAF